MAEESSPPPNEDPAAVEAFRARAFPRPAVAVDLAVFTVLDTRLRLLLVRRRDPPFRDWWALPGGFLRVGPDDDDQGEHLDEAAHRELEEETGLGRSMVFLEQLYTFGDAGRDPRIRVITVAYYALVRPDLAPMVTAGSDASDVDWHHVDAVARGGTAPGRDRVQLAFDHGRIVQVAMDRIRGKIDYSPIAFDLVPATFTVAELRAVFEAIKGESYDPSNFRRRFKRMVEDGTIEQAPGKRLTTARPARVYRFGRRRS